MSVDPERRIQEIIDENNERLEQYRELAGNLSEISGTASSPDNLVRVTVAHTGMLKDVYVSHQIAQNPPRDLGQTIVSLAQQAHAEASRQMAQVVEPVLGADSDTMRIIQGFVPPENPEDAQQPAPGPERHNRPRGQDRAGTDDDDDFGGSILR